MSAPFSLDAIKNFHEKHFGSVPSSVAISFPFTINSSQRHSQEQSTAELALPPTQQVADFQTTMYELHNHIQYMYQHLYFSYGYTYEDVTHAEESDQIKLGANETVNGSAVNPNKDHPAPSEALQNVETAESHYKMDDIDSRQYDDEEVEDEGELVLELTPEMIEFFRDSERRKRERDQELKREKNKARKKRRTERKRAAMEKQKEDRRDYVGEYRDLYGEGKYEEVMRLERELDEMFTKAEDGNDVPFWPVIPISW